MSARPLGLNGRQAADTKAETTTHGQQEGTTNNGVVRPKQIHVVTAGAPAPSYSPAHSHTNSVDSTTIDVDAALPSSAYQVGLLKPSSSRQHARDTFRAARARFQFDLPAIQTKKRSDFILLPTGRVKPWWDLLVVLLVIYSAFSLPVILCFDLKNARISSWDVFVDVVFYLDVVFYFFTAYDENGVTVYSRKKIALKYVKGWFTVDLIACLPWEQMAGAVTGQTGGGVLVSILRGCKALRLLRLSRLFKFLESHAMVSHAMRMIRMLFFFFLFAHWFGCLWFAIGAYGSRHSNGLDGWMSALSPPLDPDVNSFEELYVTSLYWVFTTWVTIGYGDIVPHTDLEKCFAMGTMVAGAVIYATIFGNVAILLQSLGRLDNIFKDKMEHVGSYMVDLQLPTTLQLRIRNYYTFLWARHKSFSASNQLEELPASLTNQIAHYLHRDTIEKCSIFKDAEEPFLRSVTTKLKFCVSLPGDFVFKEDDAGDKIYFLRKGRVEIENDEYGTLAVLEEGAYFGDVALLIPLSGGGVLGKEDPAASPTSGASSSSSAGGGGGGLSVLTSDAVHLRRKRTASAKSVMNSDMYYLTREEFLAILQAYPSYAGLFTEISRARFRQTKMHSDEVLVEKILEQWAKKGWLKLRGVNKQPEKMHANGGSARRQINTSSVIAAMTRQPFHARGASDTRTRALSTSSVAAAGGGGGEIEMSAIGAVAAGGGASNGAVSSSAGASSLGVGSSSVPASVAKAPIHLGMKGMLILAAIAEHKRDLRAGIIPAMPEPEPEPRPANLTVEDEDAPLGQPQGTLADGAIATTTLGTTKPTGL